MSLQSSSLENSIPNDRIKSAVDLNSRSLKLMLVAVSLVPSFADDKEIDLKFELLGGSDTLTANSGTLAINNGASKFNPKYLFHFCCDKINKLTSRDPSLTSWCKESLPNSDILPITATEDHMKFLLTECSSGYFKAFMKRSTTASVHQPDILLLAIRILNDENFRQNKIVCGRVISIAKFFLSQDFPVVPYYKECYELVQKKMLQTSNMKAPLGKLLFLLRQAHAKTFKHATMKLIKKANISDEDAKSWISEYSNEIERLASERTFYFEQALQVCTCQSYLKLLRSIAPNGSTPKPFCQYLCLHALLLLKNNVDSSPDIYDKVIATVKYFSDHDYITHRDFLSCQKIGKFLKENENKNPEIKEKIKSLCECLQEWKDTRNKNTL